MRAWSIGLLVMAAASARPLRAQCPDGTPPPCGRRPPPAANSVAVLYFVNASRDSTDQYLAEGITEEIATSLARVGRLHVVSPAAVRHAQLASGDDLLRLSRALNVRHLVEGSLRRAGGQARVTARLLGSDARTALWADAYTRPTADLLSLEEEIARQIASGVIGTLLPDEQHTLAIRPINAEAHDRLLRGNYLLARRTGPAIGRAITEYQAAVTLDSGYAPAWGRLALAYALLRNWGFPQQTRDPEAESTLVAGDRAATRALALDSTIADAWSARGYIRLYRDPIALRGVLAAFRRAVALDPRGAEAHHQLGMALGLFDSMDAARAEALHALELEPGRLITFRNLANVELIGRRYAEARRWGDSAVAADPTYVEGHRVRLIAEAMLGDTSTAIEDARRIEQFTGAPPGISRCWVLALIASPEAPGLCSPFVFQRLESAEDSAFAFRAIGDTTRMYDALDAAVAQRTPFLRYSLRLPFWNPFADQPRFRAIMRALRPAGDAVP